MRPPQAASRSPILRRISYEEMVHRKPSLPSSSGDGVRGTLIALTQWVLILQVKRISNWDGVSPLRRDKYVEFQIYIALSIAFFARFWNMSHEFLEPPLLLARVVWPFLSWCLQHLTIFTLVPPASEPFLSWCPGFRVGVRWLAL